MKGTLVAVVVLVAAGALWIWSALDNEESFFEESQGGAEEQMYTNEVYGYSVIYSPTLRAEEYTPQVVAIGTSTGDEFKALAEVAVAESGGEGGYENFNEFLFERGRTLCAADGPGVTISCTKIVSQEPFTTDSGVTGEAVTFELVRTAFATSTTAANTTATSTFGPVYSFNLGANAPNSDFAVLLIYQPLASYLEEPRPETVEEVVSGIHIDKVESR